MRKTVVFDLDGTLLNTLDDLTDAVNLVLEFYGYEEHTKEEIRSFVGNGVAKLMERALPEGKENLEYEAVLEDFKNFYTENCDNKTAPYDGILTVLQRLRDAGFRTAIVSNKNEEAVKKLADEYFKDTVETATGVGKDGKKKPDPKMVYRIREELGVSLEDMVYVGDSEVDYETARAAGIPVVLVTWGFADAKNLQSLDGCSIVDTPEELLEVLVKDME